MSEKISLDSSVALYLLQNKTTMNKSTYFFRTIGFRTAHIYDRFRNHRSKQQTLQG